MAREIKYKNINYSVNLETLTPIHIGSGNEWIGGVDIIEIGETNKRLINPEKLFQIVIEKNDIELAKELNDAIEENNLTDFIKKHKFDKSIFNEKVVVPNDFPCQNNGKNKIKKFITNGKGEFYIPGSSIKGSIRTAIINYLASNVNKESIKKNIINSKKDNDLLKLLLGKDPTTNLMKILKVSDTIPINIKSNISTIKLFRPHPQYFKTYIETLPALIKTTFTISIDDFFLKTSDIWCNGQKFNFDFKELIKIINNISKGILETHINYAPLLKDDESKAILAIQEYNNIYALFKNLKENEAIMNMGYGIGWIGMTGALIKGYLSKREFENFGQEVRLSKYFYPQGYATNMPEFPKSRRLISDKTPLGWIKLTFLDKITDDTKKVEIKKTYKEILFDKLKVTSPDYEQLFQQWRNQNEFLDDKEISKEFLDKINKYKSDRSITNNYKILCTVLGIEPTPYPQETNQNNSISNQQTSVNDIIENIKKKFNGYILELGQEIKPKRKKEITEDVKKVINKYSKIKEDTDLMTKLNQLLQ